MNRLTVAVIYCFTGWMTVGVAQVWQKTPVDTIPTLINYDHGFPIIDKYGDTLPVLPMKYSPSFLGLSDGFRFLTLNHSDILDPPELDENGFPTLDDYFQLSTVGIVSNVWSTIASFTELSEGVEAPKVVSRLDQEFSVAHWIGDMLHIETFASPSNTRISLLVPSRVGSVAIDENAGVHVLAVNSSYELWHHYYANGSIVRTKLSDGPVCHVVATAGEGDECHLAYSTFSEDTNLNGELDDGEDVNGNGSLDETPLQLIYQSIDASTPSSAEFVDDDTVLPLCDFDIFYSASDGLKIAFSDAVTNSVRISERPLSVWSSNQVSSAPSMYRSVALTVSPSGDCAVAYISEDQLKLYVSEDEIGQWSESIVSQSAIGDYFTGVDVEFGGGQLAILASEKGSYYLNAYTRSALPDYLSTLVRPTEIRGAFVVTWPTPEEDTVKQILQSTTNLLNPNSWQEVEQRNIYSNSPELYETTVEHDGPNRFYRVIELSD
ncbi:MAG: hypothetical protein ACSHX8_05960 [Opitutaceae bacterium]